jgi:2-keto-4-pentenoate hydratase/2-oxohepta-3-ene-1,7-dioic acid hydratase in catechol pathway
MRIARAAGGGLLLGHGPDHDAWVSPASIGVIATRPADLLPLLPELIGHHGAVASATPDVLAPELAAPLERPGKILAVGLNYLGHIAEVGKPRPKLPMIFAKYASAVTGPTGCIELDPTVTAELDYETELAVVIGHPARRVPEASALEHVLGYCVANDVSARDLQRAETQVSRSKGQDTFCPLGPWITTTDEVADPHHLRIRTTVNGAIRQDSSTSDLLFGVAFLVAHLSRTMTLETGDVILTGTPSGVGSGMCPPTYLSEGDTVRSEIEGLGSLENTVVIPAVAR